MLSRPRTVSLVFVMLVMGAITAFAQGNSQSNRAYRRPTITRGSPARPLTGPNVGHPRDLAVQYIRAYGKEAELTPDDTAELTVTGETSSAHNGITHVYLRQLVNGLEVFGAETNFNIGADGAVLSFGTSFLPELKESVNLSAPQLGALAAASAAAASVGLTPTAPLEALEVRTGPEQETTISDGGIASSSIVAKLVYQPVDLYALRLAWQVDIEEVSALHNWRINVDAETGEVLNQEDFVVNDNWDAPSAAGAKRPVSAPKEGPNFDSIMILSSPSPVADGSSYNVYALPKESPNDGPRTIVMNPADSVASPFGWHDTNAAAGAEFFTGRGNNVHAYLDQDANNAADFGEPSGGTTLTFDFAADLNQHAQNYREAVVTNLFYWNNIIHDVMYRRGFTEAAGNFQANNYGRGGTQGDYVRAEAADGGGTNNANFNTPVETATSGGTPRMQMFLWPGNQFGPQNQVIVDGVGEFGSSWSRFGAAPSVAGTSGRIINAGNGCVAGDYGSAPAGNWMAIVTGGNSGCQNVAKARTAEAAGAKALIVAHTTTAAAPVLTGSLTTTGPTIPIASITRADGDAIRAAILAGPVTGSVRKHPNHPGIRDGDFEDGIVIHEYGHGISTRLTGGPATNCLNNTEQAGEGWSDYFAILMLLNPELDDPDSPRGMGPYALFQDSRQGGGIRPRPYSRDMEIQPFTYDSIKTEGWLDRATLAVPHGLGHGWAAVLWDMTWDLVDKHGFNPNIYDDWWDGGNNRALQYVIDGLKLQGCSPSLVQSARAIIAATEALGGEDTCTVWASFARRGLGYSAVAGSSGNRDDNTEAFDTAPSCRRGFIGKVDAQPKLNVVNLGSTVALNFAAEGLTGLDILAANSPYSRQVDCVTLQTITPGQEFITPRPYPIPTESPGNSGLSYDPATGRYTYPWKTNGEWNATCRELVLTRNDDGLQHRAYFRFVSGPSFTVSGYVRDSAGQPLAGTTVRLPGAPFSPTTTDASGFYSIPDVPKGTYEATADGRGCNMSLTLTVDVSKPTTLNFTLPAKTDSFGYRCHVGSGTFEEALLPIPTLTGDDVTRTIDLPFAFTFYGTTYTRAHVSTNGFMEFVGPTSTVSTFTNTAIPTTGRPNGAVYPFWDDLFVDVLNASVRTELKGEAPNRRFVIEWRNVHFFSDTSRRVDLNVVLYENGEVVTNYRNIASDGREQGNSATIGIENGTGTVALQVSFNGAVLSAEPAVTSIRFWRP